VTQQIKLYQTCRKVCTRECSSYRPTRCAVSHAVTHTDALQLAESDSENYPILLTPHKTRRRHRLHRMRQTSATSRRVLAGTMHALAWRWWSLVDTQSRFCWPCVEANAINLNPACVRPLFISFISGNLAHRTENRTHIKHRYRYTHKYRKKRKANSWIT